MTMPGWELQTAPASSCDSGFQLQTTEQTAMRSYLPRVLSRPLRELHRTVTFRQAMNRFIKDPRRAAEGDGAVFDHLVYGWGNEGWSGQREYLQACVLHAIKSKGPILECGSGLTTLLVGYVAHAAGTKMWTLEHLPSWAAKVQLRLHHFGIESVRLCISPIRQHGGFDWYDAPLHDMPERFALVICDGPPAATRGGRYGLCEVMRDRLLSDCTILLDDARRSDEKRIAEQWMTKLDMSCQVRGAAAPFFELRS
jgi:hypothetical protein